MSVEDITNMFELPDFSEVVELGISGGEPYMRDDIDQIFQGIFKVNKSIKSVFITTNASFHMRVMKSCQTLIDLNIANINIGVSIDGRKETNKAIRGVDSYDAAVDLLKNIKEKYPTINTSISYTVCKKNCTKEDLLHVQHLSEMLDCSFSFRTATESEGYYNNNGTGFDIDDEQKKILMNFIIEHKLEDKFMQEQLYYLATMKIPVMKNNQTGEHLCLAGKKFIFVQSNGDFYPCLYSNEIIGNYKEGFTNIKDRYTTHSCPCMTECTIWPMLLEG